MTSSESSDRWREIRSLLERALELPDADRAAFVAREAGTDEALRSEIEALLARDGEQGLDAPRAPAIPDASPERLGAYRILRKLGQGGMGTVYLGVRADGQFKKRVAVKVIRRGMDTEDVLRRFERERQVLANLDHPGIARLIDGGMSQDGLPYLVMEYVEGEPLTRWCDAQRFGIRERIELFCQICDAVHDAHKSLVVHRDLKPSNVLVTTEGQPKLLDFGIAKVLDPEKDESTVDLTATPLRLLTPAYASPEQVAGTTITTASDVYALGAILYELLVGRTPLEFETSSAAEVERVARDQNPQRPSRAAADAGAQVAERRDTSTRTLERALRGDLDTIVGKALRKEPRRRYGSASELAEELRDWLRGMPISARPDTVGYRFAKFVRRNAWPVATAAALLLAFVASFAVSVLRGREAQQARDELARQLEVDRARNAELAQLAADLREERGTAEARADELERISGELQAQSALAEERYEDVRTLASTMVFDVHRKLMPLAGSLEAKRLVIESGIPFLESLAEQRDDPALERGLAAAYLRLATVQCDDVEENLGLPEESLATLDKAVELGESLRAREPGNMSNDFTLGSALQLRGDLLAMLGRSAEAEEAFARAAQVCGLEEEAISANGGRNYMLATSLLRLAGLLSERGELDEAEEYLFRSRELIDRLRRSMPQLYMDLLEVLRETANIHEARLDVDVAGEVWEEAVLIQEEVVARAPNDDRAKRLFAGIRRDLVGSFLRRELTDAAAELALEVLEDARRALERSPNAAGTRTEYARSLYAIAQVRSVEGNWEAVRALSEEQLQIFSDLLAEDPQNTFIPRMQGAALLLLSTAQREEDRLLEAEETLRRSLEIYEALAAADPANGNVQDVLARTLQELGEVYVALGSPDLASPALAGQWNLKAQTHYERALAVLNRFERLTPEVKKRVDQIRAALDALP